MSAVAYRRPDDWVNRVAWKGGHGRVVVVWNGDDDPWTALQTYVCTWKPFITNRMQLPRVMSLTSCKTKRHLDRDASAPQSIPLSEARAESMGE